MRKEDYNLIVSVIKDEISAKNRAVKSIEQRLYNNHAYSDFFEKLKKDHLGKIALLELSIQSLTNIYNQSLTKSKSND